MITVDRINGVTGDLAIKTPVRVATTANITLEGLQTIDGIALAADDRVLVKNQTTAANNGIWIANTSAWSRALDFDGRFDVVQGTMIPVVLGTVNAGSTFKLDTASPVIGTSSLSFSVANDFALRGDLASTASGKGSALVGFIQNAIGAVARTVLAKLRDSVSVKDFGAVGDGVTNDTAAIQAAIDHVSLARGSVFFPPGTYLISSTLNITSNGVVLFGAGRNVSKINVSVGSINGIKIGNNPSDLDAYTYFCQINDLQIYYSVAASSGTAGLYCEGAAECKFNRLAFDSCDRAIRMEHQTLENTFNDVFIRSCKYGVTEGLNSTATKFNIDNEYLNFKIYANVTGGFQLEGTSVGDCVIDNAIIVGGCTSGGISFIPGGANYRYDLKIVNPTVDSLSGPGIVIQNAIGCNVVGGWVSSNSSYGIHVIGSQNISINGTILLTNTNADISLTDSTLVTVSGVSIRTTLADAVFLEGCTGCTVSGSNFDLLTAVSDGVSLQTGTGASTKNTIYGNTFKTYSASTAGIREQDSSQDFNIALGNIVIGAGGYVFGATDARGASSIFENNQPRRTAASFTFTMTGLTTSPTGTAFYEVAGNNVVLSIPTITGTSNATTATLTGLPAHLIPTRQQNFMVRMQDNGGAIVPAQAFIDSTTGVLNLTKDLNGNAFTAAGTKTIGSGTVAFMLN